ncbi:hypothetical protein PIB30_096887 [Stylosanthes scabra]|uniref:Uncharacterized protein n=1 Tax=Stylosanthes scabra TaxID=79078 RepID=A0ABU6YVQ6_9FABA|nr:hypothetical protein [Stylosanthes scabra]
MDDVSQQIQLTSHLQKLPEEVLTIQHHDETTFGASLTTHKARNVGNVGLPEFGATVSNIGPGQPKSPNDTHIESFDKTGPILCGPTSHTINLQKIEIQLRMILHGFIPHNLNESAWNQVRLLNPTTLHALGELPNPYLAKLC